MANIAEYVGTFNAEACQLYLPHAAPEFDVSLWDGAFRRASCYPYALNIRAQRVVVPGTLKQAEDVKPFLRKDISENLIRGQILNDGLEETDFSCRTHDGGHLVAAFVAPGRGFHFYGLNSDGFWSHKMPDTKPKLTDASGLRVRDPKHANNGIYTDFVGYFRVPEQGIECHASLDSPC